MTRDLLWRKLLRVRDAILDGEKAFANVDLDAEKYFDLFCWQVLFPLAEKFGMPSSVLRVHKAFYRGLQRRIRIGDYYGPAFGSTNSMLQGCALTLVYAAMLSTIWARAVRRDAPEALPFSFVDDRSLGAEGPRAAPASIANTLCKAVATTVALDEATGTRLQLEKSTFAATTKTWNSYWRTP